MTDNLPFENDNLKVCNACFCCNVLLWLDTSDIMKMLGCQGERGMLCCRDSFCCKVPGQVDDFGIGLNKNKRDSDFCQLALFCCECALQQPIICCEGTGQCLCLVQNLSCMYPMKDTVPMMCGLCTIVLYPSFNVFSTQKDIVGSK